MSGPLDAILEANPSSSADGITEAVALYVEACIINTLISLPPMRIPTPAHARLEEMMTRRRGKSGRVSRRREDYESRLAELYRLRRQLDGYPENGTVPNYVADSSDIATVSGEAGVLPPRDTPNGHLHRKESELIRRPTQMTGFQGTLIGARAPELVVRGHLEPSIANLIVADPILEEIVMRVEARLRAFALERGLPMEFDFRLGEDPEYPKWRRYILELDSNLDFDSKMTLWTEIDSSIRQELRQLGEERYEMSQRIADISSNLFVHMGL